MPVRSAISSVPTRVRLQLLAQSDQGAPVPELAAQYDLPVQTVRQLVRSDPNRIYDPAEYRRALNRATQAFLQGSAATSPAEAIARGERSLTRWCELLRNLTEYADPET
jgi:hypothetical protein